MTASPRLLRPETLLEATGALREHGEDSLVVGGATAVSLMLHHGLVTPRVLVALGNIGGLREVTVNRGVVTLGALVTHHDVVASRAVARTLPVLAEAFGVVGNHRVRAAATVGGVLAEADHASDPPALLRALDAVARVVGADAERRVAVADLLTGHYETSLHADEVIAAVEVPLLEPGTVATYAKFRSTASEDRPCVGVAAVVRLDDDGLCDEVRVCVGAACEVPMRLPDVEQWARGRRLDARHADEVADAYAAALRPVADVRGSAWYRREMVRVHVARTLMQCMDRQRGEHR